MKGISIPKLIKVSEKIADFTKKTQFAYSIKDGLYTIATSYFIIQSEDSQIFDAVMEKAGAANMEPGITAHTIASSMLYPQKQESMDDTGIFVSADAGLLHFFVCEKFPLAVNEAYYEIFKPQYVIGTSHNNALLLLHDEYKAGILPVRLKDQKFLKRMVDVSNFFR